MPLKNLIYRQDQGVYYVQLSRAQIEAFIAASKSNSGSNNSRSINNFAKEIAVSSGINIVNNAKVFVDFSNNYEGAKIIDLSNLNFSDLDMRGAVFSGVNLKGCKFENTNLEEVNFKSADLSGAHFLGCQARSANLIKANLDNVIIENSDFQSSVFNESKSAKITIQDKSNFSNTAMINVSWQKAVVRDSNFNSTTFERSNVDGVKIINCDFRNVSFNRASAQEAVINNSNFSKSSLDGANMKRAIFDTVKLENLSAYSVNLYEAEIKPSCKINNVDLRSTDLRYANLSSCNLSNVDLAGSDLHKCNLNDANITRRKEYKSWFKPSSETVIKTTTRASIIGGKVGSVTSNVASAGAKAAVSGLKYAASFFSRGSNSVKLAEGSLKKAEQKLVIDQSEPKQTKKIVHYNKIVNSLTSTRLIAEDIIDVQEIVSNLTNIIKGLFMQDEFFPRAKTYGELVAQVEAASKKGYITQQDKNDFISKLKHVEVNENTFDVLPRKMMDKLLNEATEKEIPYEILEMLKVEFKLNNAKSNIKISDNLRNFVPEKVELEVKILKDSLTKEYQQYYTEWHGQFTKYMLSSRVDKLFAKGILKEAEKNELHHKLNDNNHKFDEQVNRQLEKYSIINASEKLRPFMHVLTDPKFHELTEIIGKNKEDTLAILDNFKSIFKIIGLGEINLNPKILQYVGIAPSIVALVTTSMKHEKDFEIILSGLQDMFGKKGEKFYADGSKKTNLTMDAIGIICKLVSSDQEFRRVLIEEVAVMNVVLTKMLEKEIQTIGLEVGFINRVTQFAVDSAKLEEGKIFGLFSDIIQIIQNPNAIMQSLQDQEKFEEFRVNIRITLPNIVKSQEAEIMSLMDNFLKDTKKGNEINDKIAKVLGLDVKKATELKEAYLQSIKSSLKIVKTIIKDKENFLELAEIVQNMLTSKIVGVDQYVELTIAVIKLLNNKDLKENIANELPKIFASTNGILENKLKDLGLSQKFVQRSIALSCDILKSTEMDQIISFFSDLVQIGIKRQDNQIIIDENLRLLIAGAQDKNFKNLLIGFTGLVSKAGKYKELISLIQHTLPSLIENNKDHLVPLVEEFINNTSIGKRVDINVNDILKIASEKNKNLVKLADCWANGKWAGLLKETIVLLASPMVIGFLTTTLAQLAYNSIWKRAEIQTKTVIPVQPNKDNKKSAIKIGSHRENNEIAQISKPKKVIAERDITPEHENKYIKKFAPKKDTEVNNSIPLERNYRVKKMQLIVKNEGNRQQRLKESRENLKGQGSGRSNVN